MELADIPTSDWYASNTNIVGAGTSWSRQLTGAVGSWAVHLQVGYHDASGVFRFTYDGWVPTYENVGPYYYSASNPSFGANCTVN